jgi:sugar phosphate isomerase/epimerase
MLLTLAASSLRPMLAAKGGKGKLTLLDLPAYARGTLGLHGLNLSTDMLAGLPREQLERLRERADKAGAACLLLVEAEPQPLGVESDAAADKGLERLGRVAQAAQFLGCNSLALKIIGPDDPAALPRTAERLRKIVRRAEKMELNVLISPHEGLTATPERVTEIIKKVGGFRVGTLPDFEVAAASPDPTAYLRRLTPYAPVVYGATRKFASDGDAEGEDEVTRPVKHAAYDLGVLIDAIVSVGFDGTLAVDYRGGGDPTLGVIRSRRAFESLLQRGPRDVEEVEEAEEAEEEASE